MQSQRENEQNNRPGRRRPRRSVGELLAAWLLVLLGGTWFGILFIYLRPLWSDSEIGYLIVPTLLLALGFLCFLAGMASLLRARKLAQAILMSATLPLLAFGVFFFIAAWQAVVVLAVVVFVPATLFFFLGRWLGRQEDIEE